MNITADPSKIVFRKTFYKSIASCPNKRSRYDI